MPDFTTLDALVRQTAVSAPARIAVIEGDRQIDYAGLDDLVNRVAVSLQEDGLVPRDAISICALRQSSGPRSNDRSSNARTSVASVDDSRSSSATIDASGSASRSSLSSRALVIRASSLSKGSIHPFSSLTRCTTVRALSWFPQNDASAICSSRRVSSSRNRARSKMPPEFLESFAQICQRTGAF